MTPRIKKALRIILISGGILFSLLVILLLAALAFATVASTPEEQEAFGKQRNPSFSFQRKSGAEALAYVKARKAPTLITCWASWCIPCRYDMKVLHAIESKYKAQHLEWILVNVDRISSNQERYAKKVLVNMHVPEKNWAVAGGYSLNPRTTANEEEIITQLTGEKNPYGGVPVSFVFNQYGKFQGRFDGGAEDSVNSFVLADSLVKLSLH